MNLDNHPCFNPKACKSFGRVHLPVAPRCNIACKFCNRKYDCVNETRPGVTSAVLTPAQALSYLDRAMERMGNISVVGIAGPGDPFANPEETLGTLSLVRESYPEAILCVATNGLGVGPYIPELSRLGVSHVTVTVNAVDPEIGEKIYSWMRIGKRVVKSREGAEVLLSRQQEAVSALKEAGIIVKVNSIILPGVNEEHIPEVARAMAGLGADLFNAMPYATNPGSAFGHLPEPPAETVERVRAAAAEHLPQMHHCTRCRADAAGLLGKPADPVLEKALVDCAALPEKPAPAEPPTADRSCVAVASMEGVLVNQHLGDAERLFVYGAENGRVRLLGARMTPARGGGDLRWKALAETFSDCGTLLVNAAGETPRRVLAEKGIRVLEVEGLIEEAVRAVLAGGSIRHLKSSKPRTCGGPCSGDGMGCG